MLEVVNQLLCKRWKRRRKLTRRIRKTPWEKLSLTNNCTFGPLNKPVARIKPGETIEVETWDSRANTMSLSRVVKEQRREGIRTFQNPITGPLFIEGAKAGDALKIEIINVELPNVGWTSARTTVGEVANWVSLPSPPTKFSKIDHGKVAFPLKDRRVIEISIRPFVGTIGVSPAFEAISTTTPGRHGGNMDASDICTGNILYLPVAVDGALLGLGDVHAVQGDGEISGTAVEVPAKVTLKVRLEKNRQLDWPRIESKDEIMTVCSSKPLEDAARLAFLELIRWLEKEYNFERYDAYMLLSLAAKARIAQIVNPLYTVVAKLPKGMLPKNEPHE